MIYSERTSCIFCGGNNLSSLLEKDRTLPLGNFVVASTDAPAYWMPYNVQHCQACGTIQNKYTGDLSLIYENNFAGSHGSIRSTHDVLFADFITANKNVASVCEVGAGSGNLAEILLQTRSMGYTIVDPQFGGCKDNKKVVPKYFEESNTDDIQSNTIVMSHVFEHFYKPIDIIKKIQSIPSIQSIYLSMPDLESFIQEGTYHVLNSEHTYFVTNKFLSDIFEHHGFHCTRTYAHEHHSVFFEFQRRSVIQSEAAAAFPVNEGTQGATRHFFERVFERIHSLEHSEQPTYIWPCSMHTLFVLSMGVPSTQIRAVLDNSPRKIGHYLYGFGLPCQSFEEVIQSSEAKRILLAGGCYNKEVVEQAQRNPQNTVVIL